MTKHSHFLRGSLAAALACALLGCASRTQIATINAEKEQLKAVVESEKRLNEDLAARLQSASQKAAEAERELALREGGGKTARSSSSLVNTEVKSKGAPGSLEQWAKGESLLKYDSRHRSARVQVKVEFSDDDRLTFDARRELDKVADLLSSQSGSRCSAKVHGIEATAGDARALTRANAAADYLRRRGIAADRVAVATRSSSSLVDEEGRKVGAAGSSIEIELVPRDATSESIATEPGKSAGDGWSSSQKR